MEYLRNIVDMQAGLTEQEIRERVESHMVPYDLLMRDDNLMELYPAFIRARAQLMVNKIRELGAWPGTE